MTACRLQRILSLILFGVMMISAAGHCGEASSGEFYVGAGIGVANVSEDVVFIDDSSSVLKALVGYRFNETISLEATAFGLDDFEAVNPLVPDAHRAVADGGGFNASVVFSLPVSGRVDITGRAGVLFWHTGSDLGDIDDAGTDMTFGVGVAVKLTDAVRIRAGYEVLDFGDTDVTAASATLTYTFAGRRK